MKRLIILFILGGLYSCGSDKEQDKVKSNEKVTFPDTLPATAQLTPVEDTFQAKLPIFNKVSELRTALSPENAVWIGMANTGDPMGGYKQETKYIEFGKGHRKSAIVYLIESKSRNYVQMVSLKMDIKNDSDKGEGIELFQKAASKTFKIIGVDMPLPVSEAIGQEKDHISEDKNYTVVFEINKGTIETWTLKIATR